MTLWDKLEDIRKNIGKEINVRLCYRKHEITDYMTTTDFIINMRTSILNLDESKYIIEDTMLSDHFIIRLKKEVFE